ncbi:MULTISPECIES: DUF3093 domain-containing protein [unclassified Arthrobacter]|uniref:DUF3093 domain-containing protein n=1 Tax=unclassified Arthrobacter TaxID=235627 RepID=UPI00159E9DFF|nr:MULTISPECIES: DUF3093 domain-containing protein [unclassified Arthrobacter]MCQ9164084.1 DUF3093 domain-containing protein [Arthrobacter sp. STN4]NVM97880.1 DUF3093 domain-containing protein [Arthrobacter sp. SDTb3-6]
MSSSSVPAASAAPLSTATYTEKLWPGLGVWVVVLGLSAAGILILIPISPLAGYLAFVGLLVLQTLVLVFSTPKIEVTAGTLQVGRAVIEREYIGDVTYYLADDATAQRGTRLNGLAYLCIRGWIKPVVKVEITDPHDKTPYWLTSTRNPERLAAALGQGRG